MIRLETYTPRHARTQYDALAEGFTDSNVCPGRHCRGMNGLVAHRTTNHPIHPLPRHLRLKR